MNLQFMSLICSTTCGAPNDAPTRYDDCSEDVFREAGANHFILETCDSAWTDILSPSEWTTKIGANDVKISPAGKLTINEPTSETIVLEGCGREVVTNLVYLIDFETYQASTDLSDWDYWYAIFNGAKGWRIMLLDCEDVFHVATDWVAEVASGTPATIAGEKPGMEFSLVKTPSWIEGDNGLGKWSVQFQIKIPKMMGMVYLPGVPAVL